jgi:hypothetical protein
MSIIFSSRPERVNKTLEVCTTDQNLGQKIGSVDVQCTFKAKESRWATNDETELYGLLRFNIQFTDPDSTPLKTAIITIVVGANDSDRPLFVIDETAPVNGITGVPIKQPIRKTKAIDPDIELGAAGTNVKASGPPLKKKRKSQTCTDGRLKLGYLHKSDKPGYKKPILHGQEHCSRIAVAREGRTKECLLSTAPKHARRRSS